MPYWLITAAFATLIAGEIRSLFAQPSRIAVGVACLGVVVSGALLAYSEITAPKRYEWAKPRYYSLPVDVAGAHTIKINSIKGLPGYVVKPVAKGTRHDYAWWGQEHLPFPMEDIRRCGWRIVHPKIDVHFHDQSCQCAPQDYLFEIREPWDQKGTPGEIEVEFQVSNETRSILSAIELQVGFPFGYGNDLAIGKGIDGIIRFATIGGILLGALGLSAQLVRKHRARSRTTPGPSVPTTSQVG